MRNRQLERLFGSYSQPVRYLTEKRGGWDEWSDEYRLVTTVVVGTDAYPGIHIDDRFASPDGEMLTVEFPSRPDDRPITVEQYDPAYSIDEYDTLDAFNQAIESGEIIPLGVDLEREEWA